MVVQGKAGLGRHVSHPSAPQLACSRVRPSLSPASHLPDHSNVANTAITTAAPPKTQAQLQKEQLAATAKNLKIQILSRSASGASVASGSSAALKLAPASSAGRLSAAGSTASGKKEVKTLDEYLAGAALRGDGTG